MIENRVSAILTDQDVADILALLQQVEKKLGFTVSLTPEERGQIPKMGAKSRAFVEKGVEVASQHPDLLPRYLDPNEMSKDLELHRQLSKVFLAISRLYYNVDDTLLVAGSEAFTAALIVYRSLQHLSGGPGLTDALNEMKKRFVRSSRANDDDDTSTTPPTNSTP